jgi:hypothetical protein
VNNWMCLYVNEWWWCAILQCRVEYTEKYHRTFRHVYVYIIGDVMDERWASLVGCWGNRRKLSVPRWMPNDFRKGKISSWKTHGDRKSSIFFLFLLFPSSFSFRNAICIGQVKKKQVRNISKKRWITFMWMSLAIETHKSKNKKNQPEEKTSRKVNAVL